MPDWLKQALAEPTTSVAVVARALRMNKDTAYAEVRAGRIPSVPVGARGKRIPTAWLKRVLQIEEAA